VGITGAGQAPDAFFIWSTIGEAPAGRPNGRIKQIHGGWLAVCVSERRDTERHDGGATRHDLQELCPAGCKIRRGGPSRRRHQAC